MAHTWNTSYIEVNCLKTTCAGRCKLMRYTVNAYCNPFEVNFG